MLRRAAILCLLLWMLSPVCYGIDLEKQLGTDELRDGLPREAQSILEDVTMQEQGLEDGLLTILDSVAEESGGILKRGASLAVELLAVVLLSSVFHIQSGGAAAMHLASTLAVGMITMGTVSGFFVRAAETVDEMATFASFLFPVMATATASAGGVGRAGALYTVTAAVCGGMAKVLEALFLPAVSCFSALVIANSAMEDSGLKVVADTIKQLLGGTLKLIIIGFTAYLSLTGVISGSADSAAIRAAKLTISTAVPLVGSLLSDASETLLVSAGLLRSGVGIFGLLGVLAICIMPFLETGVSYLFLKLTSAGAGMMGEKQLSGLIGGLADGMGMLTAITGVCALILMVGCVCFMGGAGG